MHIFTIPFFIFFCSFQFGIQCDFFYSCYIVRVNYKWSFIMGLLSKYKKLLNLTTGSVKIILMKLNSNSFICKIIVEKWRAEGKVIMLRDGTRGDFWRSVSIKWIFFRSYQVDNTLKWMRDISTCSWWCRLNSLLLLKRCKKWCEQIERKASGTCTSIEKWN